jgi:hypothetical protein
VAGLAAARRNLDPSRQAPPRGPGGGAGIPVTTVARTLFDYAEVVDFRRLEYAWEEADRLKLLRLNEVDALWPAAKLIVELDSWEFHSDRDRDTRLLLRA